MADSASPPKKKKLPFKPTVSRRAVVAAPTASASPANVEDSSPSNDASRADGLSLFRRSKEMAPMLAADLERRRRKKERQKQAEDERRRSSLGEKRPHEDEDHGDGIAIGDDHAVVSPFDDVISPVLSSADVQSSGNAGPDDLYTPPPSKRSRNNNTSPGEGHVGAYNIDRKNDEPGFIQTSPSTRTTRSQTNRQPRPDPTQPPSTAPILLDSDSEPEVHAVKPLSPSNSRQRSIELVQESQAVEDNDDDFEDFYVRKAEADRARQREEQQRQQEAQQRAASISGHSGTPSAPSATHKAEILVSSTIPGSAPCKAIVRFDQPLRLLRDSWAAKQRHKAGLPIQDSDAILTWRRSRVYNTSTLYNLNLTPLSDGRIKPPSSDGNRALSRSYSSTSTTDGLTNDRTQVLFEAWTTATFAEMEREEAKRKEGVPSSQPDGAASDGEDNDAEEEEEEAITLKVLLRARGLPDVGLTVRPATTSETLIMAFRNQITTSNPDAIPAGMGVQLWFDGEQLEEHMTLEEADIADRDIIEVHLRPI